MIVRFATVAAVVLLLAPAAHANLVTNGGFETGTGAPSLNEEGDTQAIGSTNMTGWTVVNNSGGTTDTGQNVLWIGNGGYGLSTPFGTSFIDLTGTTDSIPYAGVTQTISTVIGQAYVLTFDLGVETSGGVFGGVITAQASAGLFSTVFDDNGTTGTLTSDGTIWTDETLDFTASSNTTDITLIGETDTGGEFIGLDNVAVNGVSPPASVPEPASIGLLGASLIGIGFSRRRGKTA